MFGTTPFFQPIGRKWYPSYYEGEGGAPAPAVTPPGNTTPAAPGAGAQNGTFTQEQVNALLAKNKRDLQEQNRTLAEQLTQLKESKNLTEQEREQLESRISQLTSTFQTEAETKALEFKKAETKLNDTIKNLTSTSESWKNRFEGKMIAVDIAAAAVEYKAFSVEQVSAILAPLTKVVEELGEDGKPTGNFVPKVDFMGEDKDGKPVKLNLSVGEAVKTMTQMPNKYGNLFRADGAGGIGAQPNGGSVNGGRLPNLENMSVQDYAKHRTNILQRAK